jgi:transcriptional regulator
MYLPPHFAETDPTAIAATIAAAPLACIVAQTPAGLIANHIPVLAAPDGALIGHVALANDMHRQITPETEVIAIFRAADAYVSPAYYPSKADHHRHVPTWNYDVVHIHGHLAFRHDDHAKRAAVALLTRDHERRVNPAAPWRMSDAPADYIDTMLAAIVAFRLVPHRIIAKAKLSQNRESRDHAGAVTGLRASGHDGLATRMETALPAHPPRKDG